jgi:plasmid stabilization system protein ParE
MAKRVKVIWTKEAEEQLEAFYRFVQKQWSTTVADGFLERIIEFEKIIERYPGAYVASHLHPNIRLGKIHKHVQVIYEIQEDRTYIVALIDNRSEISGPP